MFFSEKDKFTLEITQRCPNLCLHCSSNSGPSTETTIALEKAKLLVDQAVKLGAKIFVLSGGEPLVYKDLLTLISHIRAHNARVVIYTSGSLVDDAQQPLDVPTSMLTKLSDLKIDRFNLSLHSHTPAIHDEFMNVGGSWARAMKFLDSAKKNNLEVHVHTVITHLNYGEVFRLANCLNAKGVKELRLLRLVPQGRAANADVFRSLEPTDADWISVIRQLKSFLKANRSPDSLAIHLGAHLSVIGKQLPGLREYQCSLDEGKLLIAPNGAVSVCPALKGIGRTEEGRSFPSQPNAFESPLEEIIQTSWRDEIKDLKNRFRDDCPAQKIYANAPAPVSSLTQIQTPTATTDPVALTDNYLIECLDRNLGKLGFPDYCADRIRKAVRAMRSVDEFNQGQFSIFYYSSQAANAKNAERLVGLDELWRAALEGAIYVLKQHDLRENPTRFNFSEPDWPVTPPPIDELANYYKQAAEFERVIYGFDPWYRDHFAHVIKVWLIGLHVIVNLPDGKLTPPHLTTIEDLNAKLFEPEELYAAFTVAALTHDLGYPLQKVAKLNDVLSRTLESIGGVDWQPLHFSLSLPRHQTAQHLLNHLSSQPKFRWLSRNEMDEAQIKVEIPNETDKYRTATSAEVLVRPYSEGGWGVVLRSQWKYHEKYHDSLERNHHGLLSALLLIRKLLYFKEGEFALEEDYFFSLEEARQFIIRREILRALATHTCPEIYILNLLSVESLLFFCDEIQEWGRPQFADLYEGKRSAGPTEVILHSYNAKKVHWEVNVGEMQQSSASYWLLSSGRKLFDRLRSAPEASERDFDVQWSLAWKSNDQKYVGTFLFSGKKSPDKASELSFSIKNQSTGSEEKIRGLIAALGSGEKRDKIQAELTQILNDL